MCQSELNPIPLPHPFPLCLPSGFFFPSLLLSHPPFYFVFPPTKAGLQSAARGFSWELFVSHEEITTTLCCQEVWASDLLVPALLLRLGLSLLPRPISYTAVNPAVFLGFLSWHQARFSTANLAPIIFCIVLSQPLSYHGCIVPFWLPLRFLSVFWLFVYHCRLSFSAVLMSFIRHLVTANS